uniref:ATP-binding cassette sub-family B member 8, mitochondrial n=1 Tax=Panagrolaimus sp. JU765 TaxID=591449 RepID=A0AC34RIQ6_9BILA
MLSKLATNVYHVPKVIQLFQKQISHTFTKIPVIFVKNEPFALKKIVKSFRLTAVCLGSTLSAFKCISLAECKKKKNRLSSASDGSIAQYHQPLTWMDVWLIIKPYIHYLILATAGAIIVAILNIQLPIMLGDVVNVIAKLLTNKSQTSFNELNPFAGKLLFLYVAQAVFTFFYITCLSIMGERMAADLRIQLLQKLLHHDMSFFDEQRSGDLTERIVNDVQEWKSSFKLCVAQGLRTFTQTGGCVISLYLNSPKMTLIIVAVVPLVIAIGTFCGAILRKMSLKVQAQNALASNVAEEAIQNIRTVKAFAAEDSEVELYKTEVEKARIMSERLGAGIGIFQAGTNIFLNGIVLGILYGGAQLIASNDLTPGQLMSFLVTSQTIQRSLSQLSLVFGHAVKGWSSLARIVEILHLKTEHNLGSQRIAFHSLFGDIVLDNVKFSYPARPDKTVFDGFSLKIEAGKTTALCGPSGAGKSTIVSLIERFYEPQDGKITRNVIGIISQEPILFATTIEENIRYGRPDASDELVKEAAKLANAHEFIETFPDKYKTVVGERGVTLSGGEKQRIAIARALLKDPPVLILDEATSALDHANEQKVQEALSRVMRNRTVLVIAHRMSTIKNADCICVIKDGKVAEQGNHASLMKLKGIYSALVKMHENDSVP